ncbi:hypothetical protein EUX98_g2851 [Antrodiella citrinella]|uniref:Protein kinase domain-containing protein n=1 Tax=Antrodiella citrinella TaxID=2447956 RepID=A0A4S4N0W5_9APHY|nr:hypothetical protein EUX98_g2851 [Antrodiella citrinella]
MSGVVDGTLEILQQGLDDPSTDSNQRNEIFRLLLRSVVDLSVLPPSYYIQGVTRQHTEPHRMGGFADVYRAMWQSQAVAIKVMRMFSSSQAEDRDPIQSAFLREIVVSRQVEHPFVQPFWGVDRVTFAPRLGLISPWQPYGNINEAMDTLSRDNTPIPYNIWLLQIAKGLQHLHCIGIVHGDLRGANILIDEHLHPRLTDFGLSILADAYTRTLGSQGGVAVRWSPPELISGVILRPNFASDVYAFGCTCIELYGRQKPFGHISNDVQVIYQLALGAQPERPTAGVPIPELLWHLISQCLDKDPARRPTVTDIVRQMEVIVQS